jgi:cytochrome P450
MARYVTRDAEIGGCPIAAGDWVLMVFAGANRDPRAYEHADELDLDRHINRHLSFGAGVHRCIGSNLARLQVRVAVEELLLAVDDLSLQSGAEVTYYGSQTRGVASLPVTFRARAVQPSGSHHSERAVSLSSSDGPA